MSEVESVIENIDLTDFAIYSGDCVNIAVALKTVFGGEFVASYAHEIDFQEGKPAHFAVRIDGSLYDGGGNTSEQALRERAYSGGGASEWDEIIVTEVKHPDRRLHNPERVETIVNRIEGIRE